MRERCACLAKPVKNRLTLTENGPVGAYGRKRFKVHPGAVNEADVPNVVARGFGGRAPRTHICSDLTYVLLMPI